MTESEKQKLKKIILKTKAEIIHEIIELGVKTTPIAPDISLGRLTRLEAIQERSINESVLVKAKIRLKKIKFSLSKIDSQKYGICSICDEEIPYSRLCVVPETTICVECANYRD